MPFVFSALCCTALCRARVYSYKCLLLFTGRRNMEENFPNHNWIISIFVFINISYVGHIMFTPSIYQFVTTPRSSSSDDQEEVGAQLVYYVVVL